MPALRYDADTFSEYPPRVVTIFAHSLSRWNPSPTSNPSLPPSLSPPPLSLVILFRSPAYLFPLSHPCDDSQIRLFSVFLPSSAAVKLCLRCLRAHTQEKMTWSVCRPSPTPSTPSTSPPRPRPPSPALSRPPSRLPSPPLPAPQMPPGPVAPARRPQPLRAPQQVRPPPPLRLSRPWRHS